MNSKKMRGYIGAYGTENMTPAEIAVIRRMSQGEMAGLFKEIGHFFKKTIAPIAKIALPIAAPGLIGGLLGKTAFAKGLKVVGSAFKASKTGQVLSSAWSQARAQVSAEQQAAEAAQQAAAQQAAAAEAAAKAREEEFQAKAKEILGKYNGDVNSPAYRNEMNALKIQYDKFGASGPSLQEDIWNKPSAPTGGVRVPIKDNSGSGEEIPPPAPRPEISADKPQGGSLTVDYSTLAMAGGGVLLVILIALLLSRKESK